MKASGVFAERRRQAITWVHSMLEDHLLRSFYEDPAVRARLPETEDRAPRGELAATQAAQLQKPTTARCQSEEP